MTDPTVGETRAQRRPVAELGGVDTDNTHNRQRCALAARHQPGPGRNDGDPGGPPSRISVMEGERLLCRAPLPGFRVIAPVKFADFGELGSWLATLAEPGDPLTKVPSRRDVILVVLEDARL